MNEIQKTSPPLEGEKELQIPKSLTLNNFWKAVVSGKFEHVNTEEIKRIIENVYFAEKDILTPLNEEEITNLKKGLEKLLKDILDNNEYRKISENDYYEFIIDNSLIDKMEKVNYYDERERREVDYFKFKIDKENYIYFDIVYEWINHQQIIKGLRWNNTTEFFPLNKPFIMTCGHDKEIKTKILHALYDLGYGKKFSIKEKIQYITDYNKKLGLIQGYRSLYEYSGILKYGRCIDDGHLLAKKEFLDIIQEIKSRIGKEDIKMLDLGGGIGEACYDAEKLVPGLTATNFTAEEEPKKFPVDTVLGIAERMPASFKEKYDLIISNISFRYYTYPDIALENCIKALSIGGKAMLDVGTGRGQIYFKEYDYNERLYNEYNRLKELKERGYIQLKINPHINVDIFTHKPMGNDAAMSAYIEIIKLKSLDE